MIKLFNYIYSIVIRVRTNDNGEYNNGYSNQRITALLVLIGLGGLINLIVFPFFMHPGALFIGAIISPVIWLMWYLLIGFEYLESVKKMAYYDALLILILIFVISLGLFSLPICLLMIL